LNVGFMAEGYLRVSGTRLQSVGFGRKGSAQGSSHCIHFRECDTASPRSPNYITVCKTWVGFLGAVCIFRRFSQRFWFVFLPAQILLCWKLWSVKSLTSQWEA